ncbi:MAG TPA: carbohydrate-binding domain-containing protein, partial [Actinotalea sp.]
MTACGATAGTATSTATTQTAAAVAATTTAENAPDHDDPADHVWDTATEQAIALSGATAQSTSDGVSVDGSTVTITAAGTYRISGSLTDGQIAVDTADAGIVRLVLDGASVSSSSGSALLVTDADEVMVVLADGSANSLSDGTGYVDTSADAAANSSTDQPNAALYSTAGLTIAGNGSLTVDGNSADGITSKDGLVITGGDITVTAVDDAIRGKDYVVIDDGTVTATAGG